VFDEDLNLSDIPNVLLHQIENSSIAEFDKKLQDIWFMPDEYKNMDIAKYVLDQCKTDEELQRAGQELMLYQERDMFILLKYMKYLVDTMRENNIIWGVGRGSSVASFVLYLINIHRINSLHWDLQIEEFLK
jgi:DNA polymerase III alpha subunit